MQFLSHPVFGDLLTEEDKQVCLAVSFLIHSTSIVIVSLALSLCL